MTSRADAAAGGGPETDPIEAWRPTAPAIFGLVDAVERRAARSIDPTLLAPVRAAVASILGPDGRPLGHDPSPVGSAPAAPEVVAACVAFAEQFVIDVAGTSDEQRSAMTAAMGPEAFTFVQVVYVTDVFRRLRIGFARLGPPVDSPIITTAVTAPEGDDADDDLWTLLERFMQLVAQRDALDPLTAELVRLRGARAHDCRLCRSRLSVRALDAAADRSVFAVDDLAHPALEERQRVALRLTDALVTQPSSIEPSLVAALHEHLSTDETVEIALDVARNAANKIAVAFGADAPVVADGTEFYDLDARGLVVADADIDVVRAATAG